MTSIQRFVQITQFDPEATRTLGQAFDMACASRQRYARPSPKASLKPAKAGERDPVALRDAGLAALSNSNAA